MAENNRPGFMVYFKDADRFFSDLSDEETGRLFKGILCYAETGVRTEFHDRFLQKMFDLISDSIDKDAMRYQFKCESNRAKAMKRWEKERISASEECHGMPLHATACNGMQTDAEHANNQLPITNNQLPITNNIYADKPHEKKRFVPPTVEEVETYCRERGNGIDASAFVSYYAASNWMRGKTKITNWKQAVITWEKNNRNGKDKDGNKDYNSDGKTDGVRHIAGINRY